MSIFLESLAADGTLLVLIGSGAWLYIRHTIAAKRREAQEVLDSLKESTGFDFEAFIKGAK